MTYDLYHGTPPHVKTSSTSLAAAKAILPKVNTIRHRILSLVREYPNGLTRDEIEELTGLPHTTSSARVRELFLHGFLETRIDSETGLPHRRLTRGGRSAEVCFAADLPSVS
jgi:hypothetical protein